MRLVYRPIGQWPGQRTEHPRPAPFRAFWENTQGLLDRELEMLDVTENPVLQLALTEADLRVDGSVKANARLAHDGVILSFEHPKAGPLSYPCDTFTGCQVWTPGQSGRGGGAYRSVPGWQMNVRAIVLGLEALRKVERYGIAGHGQQYAGWRAIGAGEPETRPMTEQEAMDFLAAHSGMTYFATCDSPRTAYRLAAKALHPDSGAVDGEAFKQLQEARRALKIGLR